MADDDLSPQEARDTDPARLVTLTDGVFAIIITILVLDLKVPDLASGDGLAAYLEEARPTFVAFVISFLLVGMYWVWHRGTFSSVRRVNLQVTWINIIFLLPTAMVPFAASVIGEYPDDPLALRFYGTVLIVVTLARVALDMYLARHPGLVWISDRDPSRRLRLVMSALPLPIYVVALLVANRWPDLSLVLYLLMPVIYFTVVGFLRVDPRTRGEAGAIQ